MRRVVSSSQGTIADPIQLVVEFWRLSSPLRMEIAFMLSVTLHHGSVNTQFHMALSHRFFHKKYVHTVRRTPGQAAIYKWPQLLKTKGESGYYWLRWQWQFSLHTLVSRYEYCSLSELIRQIASWARNGHPVSHHVVSDVELNQSPGSKSFDRACFWVSRREGQAGYSFSHLHSGIN